MYLCDKYSTRIEFRFDSGLIKGFGIEFITGASFYGVCQVPYYHIIAFFSTLQLSPETQPKINDKT